MSAVIGTLDLGVPEPGERPAVHDPEFARWDACFVRVRDGANLGLDALRGLGLELPRLPEGTLADLLVDPLVGDVEAIGENADAVRRTAQALSDLAGSAGRLSAVTVLDWRGESGSACAARIGRDAVLVAGAAEAIRAGALVFDEIAYVSARLAVTVERGIVRLGHALARLAARILARLAGPAGWAALAAEVAMRGLEAVTDIVEDLHEVLAIFEELLGLRERVVAWVDVQSARVQEVANLLA